MAESVAKEHGFLRAPPRCSNALNRPLSLRSLPNVAPTTALQSPGRLLWGIPGRSNALNIAQRLGLEQAVVDAARAKLGAAAAEVGWWRKEIGWGWECVWRGRVCRGCHLRQAGLNSEQVAAGWQREQVSCMWCQQPAVQLATGDRPWRIALPNAPLPVRSMPR